MSKKGATAIVCRNCLFFLLKSIRFGTLFWSYYNKIFLLIAYLTYGLLFILVRKNLIFYFFTYCLFNVWLIIYFST